MPVVSMATILSHRGPARNRSKTSTHAYRHLTGTPARPATRRRPYSRNAPEISRRARRRPLTVASNPSHSWRWERPSPPHGFTSAHKWIPQPLVSFRKTREPPGHAVSKRRHGSTKDAPVSHHRAARRWDAALRRRPAPRGRSAGRDRMGTADHRRRVPGGRARVEPRRPWRAVEPVLRRQFRVEWSTAAPTSVRPRNEPCLSRPAPHMTSVLVAMISRDGRRLLTAETPVRTPVAVCLGLTRL